MKKKEWTIQNSAELYGVPYWGKGFFHVNKRGNVTIAPHGDSGPRLDLHELTQDLTERGIRPPILIRFPDIIKSRVDLINLCFSKAINEYEYLGKYRGVYPIKVNQQRHLVQEILNAGHDWNMGLECGSKPELLVALAMVKNPDSLVICNGFKDDEYIETAILAQKLDKQTVIVIDRFCEVQMVINVAKKLKTKARIGFRVKLAARGSGKWVESSGAGSKFGLTAAEIVEAFELLKKAEMTDSLELIHFHIGSQITSIQAIKESLREGARIYSELVLYGATLKYIDVGGGLGIDYDGSGTSNSSINYSEQEYANDVVSTIQEICDSKKIPHPDIISESGRALVAHQSLLIFNVLGVNELTNETLDFKIEEGEHAILKELFDISENLNESNLNEYYNDLINHKNDIMQLFNYGVLNLNQVAKAEKLIAWITTKMVTIAKRSEDGEDLLEGLEAQITDTYFGNFSVFQSLPDSWAVGHLFPVMPIHKLNEKPDRKAMIVDLTCDSDGKIQSFLDIETGDSKKTLDVHRFKDGDDYYLGVFLVGAYQEILGDLHNLFGDTDAVHIKLYESGYIVDHVVEGDSVGEVLGYLEYSRSELTEQVRRLAEQGIVNNSLSRSEARLLMRHYEQGLSGYTYLKEQDSK